jgi:hypothetical protein
MIALIASTLLSDSLAAKVWHPFPIPRLNSLPCGLMVEELMSRVEALPRFHWETVWLLESACELEPFLDVSQCEAQFRRFHLTILIFPLGWM